MGTNPIPRQLRVDISVSKGTFRLKSLGATDLKHVKVSLVLGVLLGKGWKRRFRGRGDF
jgi:hypothetical protein